MNKTDPCRSVFTSFLGFPHLKSNWKTESQWSINHKTVKFKAENYSFLLGMIGLYFGNLGKKFVFQKLGKIQKESSFTARSRQSRPELDEIWETNKYHGEIVEISPWHLLVSQTSWWGLYKSRQDLGNLGEMEDISPRSRRDLECHERHGEISTISARSRQSRQVLGNLGEMEDISLRSRRDLESHKHHGEISARSLQSRRDLADLGEISPISARSR